MTDELLRWGTQDIIGETELKTWLRDSRLLTIKLGVDPTRPDLHLGHAVVLQKLRQFQDAGHRAVLLIGDFTAKIGDPSGRNKTRPVLGDEEIKTNLQSYLDQAGKIIDTDKIEIRYNSEWLSKLSMSEILGYAVQLSVNNLIEREDFATRLKDNQSVALHELLYPLMVAIDSVVLEADVELGGWDQRLNMLVGRELQKKLGQKPQAVISMKLIVGLDGAQKMSKSFDNYIGLTEPANEVFGKLMSLPDSQIQAYAELVAIMTEKQIEKLPVHPRDAKAEVAKAVVALYHGKTAADQAKAIFNQTFRDHRVDESLVKKITLAEPTITLVEAIAYATEVSMAEARRLIDQRAVRLNDQAATNPTEVINCQQHTVRLQVGKHRFFVLEYP